MSSLLGTRFVGEEILNTQILILNQLTEHPIHFISFFFVCDTMNNVNKQINNKIQKKNKANALKLMIKDAIDHMKFLCCNKRLIFRGSLFRISEKFIPCGYFS